MTKNISSIPATACNPVSLTVTDVSDCMPMVMEDVPQLDIDDLTLPCCDTSSSSSVPPQYCISQKHNGDCLSCPLSHDALDCQGNDFFICLDDYLEEPDRPSYCVQNGGDCSTYSLVNYGRDCMNNPVSDREVQP